MSNNSEKFRYNTPYRSNAALLALKFGFDKPVLEVELNELQDIQNELRGTAIRNIVPSGFIELESKNFSGRPIIYTPTDTFNSLLNCIAIAPAKAIINGMIINIYGTYSAEDGDGYTLIDLGEPPVSGTRDDLVYLEVWAEQVDSSNSFPQQGYIKGLSTSYKAVDSRVGAETSRRIVLRYDIKVAQGVDFDTFPNGLGFINANSLSPIQAIADGSLGTIPNGNLLYREASNSVFKECTFYKDYNLYVAGRPNYTLVSSTNTIVGRYIFALPMFRVSRKNQLPYSLDNFNGARTSVFKYGDLTSASSGDLLNNIRPDKICYDVIDPSDVVDLRKSVVFDIQADYYLNKSLQALMTGRLQTKKSETMRRVQFGRESIEYSSDDGVILHASFDDRSVLSDPDFTSTGEIYSLEKNFTPTYRDCVSGYGLYIDGRFNVRYDIPAITSNNGTIDFFMKPYWDGATDIIQNIFHLDDVNGNPIFVMYKNGYQLIADVYLSVATDTAGARINQMVVDLTQQLIFSGQIYHIRFSWNNAPNIAKVFTYINGNIVGQLNYQGTPLIPNSITFGSETDASTYAGLILSDEEIKEEEEPTYDTYVQQPLENETALVINEVFINNETKQASYTDTNIYVFIEQDDMSPDENNEAWLSSHTTLNVADKLIAVLPFNESALSEVIYDADADYYTKQLADVANSYWNNYPFTPSEEVSPDEEQNYAPQVVSRFTGDDPLSDTEIEQLRVLQARKDAGLTPEQIIEQAKYENMKILRNTREEMLENINYGFVLEELTIYKGSKETVVNTGVYSYAANSYWPGIPNDFIANKALIYPSFNSLFRGYSDNDLIQNRTVKKLKGVSGVFKLEAPYKGEITTEPIMYHPDGQENSIGQLVTLPGYWRKVKDDWIFSALDITLTDAIAVYNITIPKGMGGEDLPNEILAAGYVDADNVLEEISFHRKGLTTSREVNYLNPSKVSAETDRAYDFSMTRTRHMAYARLLYYHLSGAGTNMFEIPSHLYGYPVLNIISATNRTITNIQYVPDDESNPYYGFMSSKGTFVVTLANRVAYGDLIEFEIALAGTTFDYETQTKTLITNIYRTVLASVVADGNRSTFIIPLGSDTGGIIHAANSITINHFNEDGNVVAQQQKFAIYVDNNLYPYRPIQNARGINTNDWANQLAEIEIEPTSWGTPFIKFTMSYTPSEGSILTLPVLISYQPPKERIISIWYKYIPYQGILGKNVKRLKRLTDWKYFITTLSSGNDSIAIDESNTNSLNNVINRLPGGQAYAHLVTGAKIIFGTDLTNLDFVYSQFRKNLELDGFRNSSEDSEYSVRIYPEISKTVGSNIIGSYEDIEPYLKTDANYELRFIKDVVFSSENNDFDNAFFELDTDMSVYRITRGFQDERLNYTFNSFKTYLPDTIYAICKYTGMASLVQDEEGQILLFVIGCLNNGEITKFASAETTITPMFGDLFLLPGRPTALLR